MKVHAPLGLPPVPIPPDNPVTAETVALGRRLFYDPRLSADNTLSCASCHNPRLGFSDARKVSFGVGGKTGTRNAPTILNAAYARDQFWDGRAAGLEDQAAGPIANPVEMNQTHEVCASKLEADPSYAVEFRKAFGPGRITIGKVQKAIAAFERTAASGNSAFDRYQFAGDKQALSLAAVRGLALFETRTKPTVQPATRSRPRTHCSRTASFTIWVLACTAKASSSISAVSIRRGSTLTGVHSKHRRFATSRERRRTCTTAA